MNKPVVLSDLDDTLFQTRRKMVDELALEPFRTGAVDRTLNPRSFMTEEQSMLVDWLLEQAELIPVTARGTEEISRVRIPFHSWAITTHGAVILTPEGNPDEEWKAHMLGQLAPYQEKLTSMQRLITEMMDAKGINAWARLNFEYGETAVYMVEEPENGVHPKALEIILRSLSSIPGSQMLLATHSPFVVQQCGVEPLLCFSRDEQGAHITPGPEHPKLKDWDGTPDLGIVFAAGVLE